MENLWEKFLCYKFVTKFNNNLFNSITYVVLYTMWTVIIEQGGANSARNECNISEYLHKIDFHRKIILSYIMIQICT